jgi:uncharacterized protein HemX
MSRKPIPVLALAVVCALVLVAAGCGGKKKSASSATNASATTAAATTQAATTQSTQTTSNNTGAASKDCQQFAQAASKIGQDFSQAVSGTNANIDKAAKEFDQLTAKAPSDIRPDFQTIDDAFKKLAGAFNGGKPDIAKLQQISQQINTAKLTAASQHISNWATKNCSH